MQLTFSTSSFSPSQKEIKLFQPNSTCQSKVTLEPLLPAELLLPLFHLLSHNHTRRIAAAFRDDKYINYTKMY